MRARIVLLALAAAAVLAPVRLAAQQQPIFGCRAALSCRPGPFGSALSEKETSGGFFGVGLNFAPGFHVRIVTPQAPPAQTTPAVGESGIRLQGVTLRPTPSPTPAPTPAATPAVPAGSKKR
jgi:hypothetical protein